MLLQTIAHLESRIDALLLDTATLGAKIHHSNRGQHGENKARLRKDKKGKSVMYSADGIKMYAYDNWDYLVRKFDRDPSGSTRMSVYDHAGIPEERMVSPEFREFVIRNFERANDKEHAKIKGNKDMTGEALDGAVNKQRT